ncbi:MAG: hypothetical protein KKB04_03260, partial [Candidatus Thermoplasmatota archaeon]|nr:hypothetical protein [Candidatus Thermoplasmatota archaeon]
MKMGVEVEWHLVDERGNPAANHSAVVRSAKRVYNGSGNIHPEAIPDLVEMVTEPPAENFEQLRTIIVGLKDALVEGARQNNVYIAGTATTFSSSSTDGDNAGMHVHIEANIKREKIKFHNLILHVAPEIVALSTNSPIYNKRFSGYKDYRLYRTPHAKMEGKDPYTTDGTSSGNRYEFVTVDTKDNKPTVEIRGIDTPTNIDWILAIAALIRCLAEKGQLIFLEEKRNTPHISHDVRKHNYQQAAKYGLKANFISDPNIHMTAHGSHVPVSFLYHQPGESITIPAYDAAKRLLSFIEDVADDLELKPYLKILHDAVRSRKNQADIQIEWFDRGFVNYVSQVIRAPKQSPIRTERYRKQGGYLYVRQGDRRSGDNEIQLHPDTITSLRIQEGQTILISTMEGGGRSVVVKRSSRADRGKLPLGGRAVGMKKRLRREIGVSLFDPVKVGLGAVGTIPSAGFVVRTGCREDIRQTPSMVRMNPDTITQLGIQPNQTVKIASSSGTIEVIVLPPPENIRLNSEDVTLCKSERENLGVRTGDQVEVRTETITEQLPPSIEQPSEPLPPTQPVPPSRHRTFTVRTGCREDIRQTPSRARMNPDTIRQLGIQPDQTVKIASSSGTIDVVVLPP